jgi:pimeloyl-ACP methyl ester carboxylesterase
VSFWKHWLSYDGDIPFGYLLTSTVAMNKEDEYRRFCKTGGEAITLDLFIGNSQYLGKGIAHQMIQEFLLSQCTQVQEVLIDPQVTNRRAVHVYEKAGFSIVEEFIPSHSTLPHYLMHLDMDALKRALVTPTSQYVQHKGLNLWCEALGDQSKPTVILINGAGAHAHFWNDSFCDSLVQGGYYVVRFDHRDSGLSSAVDFDRNPYSVADLAEDVIAIMNALEVKKAHAVGHSMGGTIAQLLALHHPDRLLSFTSISVTPIGTSVAISEDVMKSLIKNKPTQNFEESLHGFLRSWTILNGDLPVDEDMAKEYTKKLYIRSLHPVGVAWNHIHCQEHIPPLPRQLSEISVPGLILHGEKDCLVPVQAYLNPDTKLIKTTIIPKMGHMMFHKELQQQIANTLLDHFAQSEKLVLIPRSSYQ